LGKDIRNREIRRQKVSREDLSLRIDTYGTDVTTEHFLSFETIDERIAGFLRLSLPHRDLEHPFPELQDQAMIREVHIYGPALDLGEDSQGEAQHMGLGSALIKKAKNLAQEAGYRRIAVISAIGTREYYARHGFQSDGLYMTTDLN
jgi:elongator complex protein 3